MYIVLKHLNPYLAASSIQTSFFSWKHIISEINIHVVPISMVKTYFRGMWWEAPNCTVVYAEGINKYFDWLYGP
jgi:hypothetical protein